jgi:hypothetical protein
LREAPVVEVGSPVRTTAPNAELWERVTRARVKIFNRSVFLIANSRVDGFIHPHYNAKGFVILWVETLPVDSEEGRAMTLPFAWIGLILTGLIACGLSSRLMKRRWLM